MNKEKIILLIGLLNAAEKKDYEKIVAEAGKENNIKPADLWKQLKEAGFDPDKKSQDTPQGNVKKLSVILRHKTEYPQYRRAGLVLTQKTETYEVTEEQLAMLKKDPWVVVGDGKKDGDGK